MPEKSIRAAVTARATFSARIETSYHFTFQFLRAGDYFAHQSAIIEEKVGDQIDETERCKHRAYVVGAIMQSVAALEAEAYDLSHHGPGNHQGSNEVTRVGARRLLGLCEMLDAQSLLDRFDAILHILEKPPIDRGGAAHQQISLVIKLRNELVHYKSLLGLEMERLKFIAQLRELRLAKPRFAHETSNYLPDHILSAACARWAYDSSVMYLRELSEHLGYPDYVDKFLSVLPRFG